MKTTKKKTVLFTCDDCWYWDFDLPSGSKCPVCKEVMDEEELEIDDEHPVNE